MLERINHLTLITCEETQQKRHGYWYLVHMQAMSYTAFKTKKGLCRWLTERNLGLPEELPERGTLSCQKIEGYFYRNCTMDEVYFDSLLSRKNPPPKTTKELDNGDYTLAVITDHPEGCAVTVNLLNPNVRNRVVYPHKEASEEMM